MPVTPNPTPEAVVDKTARQLDRLIDAIRSEAACASRSGQMGALNYLAGQIPLVVARLCEQARHDGRQEAAKDIEAWDWQGDYAVAAIKSAVEGAARVARGDAL